MTRIILSARRHGNARQFLDRYQVRKVVHHPAQIIHAVGVRDIGMPCLALAHLLGAAVMKAYVGDSIDNLLAI